MDTYVKNKLIEWGLKQFQSVFEQEQIDEESFKALDDQLMHQLIRKTGPLAIFKRKWKEEFQDKNKDQFVTFDTQHSVIQQSETIYSVLSDEENIVVEDLATSHDQLESTSLSVIEKFLLENVNLEQTEYQLPISNLLSTLNDSFIGRCILLYYIKNRMLTGRHQRFLCEKILDIEIRAYPDLLITPKRFIELTGMIKELFPTESEQTYYIPYTPATANSKKVGAKGKFVEIYQQYRGIAIECGVTYKKKGAKSKSVNNTGVVRLGRLDDVSEEPDDDCKEKLELLHTCIDPPEVVKHYWTVTSRVRIKELVTNQRLETFDYYSQYPALAHKNLGVDLINIDFEAIYPDKASLLSEKYTLFEKQILSYYSRIKKKTNEVKELLNTLNSNSSKDSRVTIIFLLLTTLCPVPVVRLSKENSLRPERKDIVRNFILHVKNETNDLKEKIDIRANYLNKYGLSAQPIIIVVGHSLENIVKSFVFINGIQYEVPSTLRAIDTVFKSFFSLQLDYPKVACNIWRIIQEKFYEIRVSSDTPLSPAISNILNLLNNSLA